LAGANLGQLGKASVEITVDIADLKRRLDAVEKDVAKSMKKAEGSVRVANSGISGSMESIRVATARVRNAFLLLNFAIAGMGLAKFVSAAKKQSDAIQQLEARIKSTGGAAGLTSQELQNFATQLQSVTTFGDEATIATEALLLSFTQIKGAVFKDATKAIQDVAAAMYKGQEGGLQQAAIQVGKALNDPIEGISALTRVGIMFTDQQKEQIKKFTELGQVEKAQKIILQELQVEFGGSAEAMRNTPFGEMTALGNNFGDTLEYLGKALAESLNPELVKLNNNISSINKGLALADEVAKSKYIKQLTEYLADPKAFRVTSFKDMIFSWKIAGKSIKELVAELEKLQGITGPMPGKVGLRDKLPTIPPVLWSAEDLNAHQKRLDQFAQHNTQILKKYNQDLLKDEAEYEAESLRAWEAKEQMRVDAAETARNAIEENEKEMSEFAIQAAHNIQDAFADFLFDPFDRGLEGMVQSFARAMRRIAANAIAKDLLGMIPGFAGLITSAQGNIFSGGQVVPFARGGVVSAPTLFPMARGAGLMGEAGPEAIMPLKRTSSGDLGVKSSPTGVKIVNLWDPSSVEDHLSSPAGERVILNIIQKNRREIKPMMGV